MNQAAPQNQMVMGASQYEYSIEGGKQGLQIGKTPSQGSSQGGNMPKRAPNSELNSYQSEKRLKEYKAQQQMQNVPIQIA